MDKTERYSEEDDMMRRRYELNNRRDLFNFEKGTSRNPYMRVSADSFSSNFSTKKERTDRIIHFT